MSRLSLPAGIALAALGLAFVHPAQAQTSIQFRDGTNGTALLSTQSAGFIPTTHYNVLGSNTGTNVALHDIANAPTSFTATYSANGTYYSNANNSGTAGSGTPNSTLMSAYLDTTSTVGASVTISGLDPTKSYDVYAYFNTDHVGSQSGQSDRVSSYQIGSTLFTTNLQPGSAFAGTGFLFAAGTTQNSAKIANYALFSGVTGSSFTLLSKPLIGGGGDTNLRAPIDGLQIFTNSASAAPEPSQFAGLAFTVLGLAALTLKARQRRSDAAQV